MFLELMFFFSVVLFLVGAPSYLHQLFYLELMFFPLMLMFFFSVEGGFAYFILLIILLSGVTGLCFLINTLASFNQDNQLSFLN